MKLVALCTLLFSLAAGTPTWLNDFDAAKKTAKEKHELILVNFSGSDWCGPCIRMKKEIFSSAEFATYADSIVLVNADFPRQKKNQLPKAQKKANEKLADMYNKEGVFPLTLLLSEDGKVLKRWEGLPDLSPTQFVQQIKSIAQTKR